MRKLNIATHRDLGYFFSSLIIIYCLSGIALNHVDEWNPDFIINKTVISLDRVYVQREIGPQIIKELGNLVGKNTYKVYDFPTPDQVKIYYDNASFHVNFRTGTGIYESVERRPLFYESNLFHRNSIKGWKWVADIFALLLIAINITGLFILKGKYGLKRRGVWLISAGILPPLIAILFTLA
ncbi:MAG TPA: hypothetical protein DCX54_13090 [Flavobacteriales bacterium]|nr:hypothetical protein [Flavobacteriales bacterium]